MKILLTGATGFIGGRVLADLLEQGMDVRAAVRRSVELPCESIDVGSISGSTDWEPALSGVSVVVHIAGLYPQSKLGGHRVSWAKLLQVNVESTRRLAAQSVRAGVRHFVLLSSIGAVCENSEARITAETLCRPVSAYGRSKWLGELALTEEARRGDMQTTVLRPPLVYGPGGSGNMVHMVRLAKMGIPLPFASLRNRRSFVYLDNLVSVIRLCVGNSVAFGKVYFPSDMEDVSTPKLILAIARANAGVEQGARSMEQGAGAAVASGENRGLARWPLGNRVAREKNRKTELNRQAASATSVNSPATSYPLPATPREARLFHFPPSLLEAAGRLPGLGALRKLTSSLYVDSEPLRCDLGWTPPFAMNEGLSRTLAEKGA